MLTLLLLAACCLSFLMSYLIRYYALSCNILDIPNHRSAHQQPTPRGGGLAFVLLFMSWFILCGLRFGVSGLAYPMLASASMILVALTGWVDDLRNLSARTRIVIHFSAAIMLLMSFYSLPGIELGTWMIPQGMIYKSLLVFYLVWMLNLYNFMDGIDGLAGLEAVTVCLCMGFIYYYSGGPEFQLPLMLGFAVLGFLALNLPPARIFMGDVGSSFLGFLLAFFSLQAAFFKPALFWSWLILLDVFVLDANMTLFYRLLTGQRFSEAHSTHAYQKAAKYFSSHRKVSFTVAMINIFWLMPWAMLPALGYLDGFRAFIYASLPLVYLIYIFNPGKLISTLENQQI